MRFFHARGTFLFMANTDKELKAKADKLADIILEIDRYPQREQKTIPLTLMAKMALEKRKYYS